MPGPSVGRPSGGRPGLAGGGEAVTAGTTAPRPIAEVGELSAPAATPLVLRGVRPYGEGPRIDVRVEGGVISELGLSVDEGGADVAELPGMVLLPGLVDLHVHLREPGPGDAETIDSGSLAAARGGFSAVFAMANTEPATDTPEVAEAVWRRGQEAGLVDVHPVGAITKGLGGEELTDFQALRDGAARVRMLSDDGRCVGDPALMRAAVERAGKLGMLIAQHCEEARLTVGASAHEGEAAARLGLKGWPRAAEEAIVARDALLNRDYGGRLHICHASTAGTVELLRWAKAQGIPVTAEATPHHLSLTDARLEPDNGLFRVNPPLREESDRLALREALVDGTVDVVATDHAPHAARDKCCSFDAARPGMLGLETSLAIVHREFVATGLADWRFVARVMSERPAEIAGLPGHGRPIAVGEPANLAVVDPDSPWVASGEAMASIGDNTPFEGERYQARVALTVLRGRVTHRLDTDKDS